jgi:hypothetical protein
MVAWHEVPGKTIITVPSRRDRYDLWLCGKLCRTGTPHTQGCKSGAASQTVPYGTDSSHRLPRYFVPGSHHVVPPGRVENFMFEACLAANLPITNH